MKNRFLYIALSLISVLTSCKDDEFEPLNNVAECTACEYRSGKRFTYSAES